METKASFRLICANIAAADKEAARQVAENARIPVKSHAEVIEATRVLNVLPTLAVVDEAVLTPNELKAYELALLEPIETGDSKFCAICGQEISEGAGMCAFCATEIGKSAETPMFEEIPLPLIPKAFEMMNSMPGPKQSKPAEMPSSMSEIPGAIPAILGPQPDYGQSELEMAALEAFVAAEGARAARAVREEDGYESRIDTMNEKELYNILAESTERLKPLLLIARANNIDVSEGKQLLSEVVIFSRNKEIKKAVAAMRLGEKSIRSAIKLKFLRNISMLENDVAELRSAWVSVARSQRLIVAAKGFLNAGEYSEVPINLDEARNGLKPFKTAFWG